MPSTHSRRGALLLCGAVLASLAGCATRSDSTSKSSETPTDEATTDETPTTETNVALRRVEVTPAVVSPNSPDSIGTFGERDEQFVIITLSDNGPFPEKGEFALTAGEATYDPAADDENTNFENGIWDYGEYQDVPENVLVFSVPKPLDAESVELSWPDGSESLGESALEALNRPPTEFSVELSAPDSVTGGEQATVTVTAENVGDAPGTFVGALNRQGPLVAHTPVESVSLELDAGETKEWTHRFRSKAYYDVEDPEATFSLARRGERLSATIAVDAETPS
ncbi:hypothetical protein [Halopelagius longus]|uniref:Uncharacterized protein n=1 Tax=Halopelagius longus TaxID=1236180 RepID=A0A1H1AUE7_9EURY|nr:hypothetical protein [Halopelagius longus]RDI70521.1 hypothetical protein DWB78_01610 [Halopelagius longus]SDQ43309.1 hypothetical protein SAMN05216278_1496 [Halopelagius longus]